MSFKAVIKPQIKNKVVIAAKAKWLFLTGSLKDTDDCVIGPAIILYSLKVPAEAGTLINGD